MGTGETVWGEARPCGGRRDHVGAGETEGGRARRGETRVEASKTMWNCCDSFHLAQAEGREDASCPDRLG